MNNCRKEYIVRSNTWNLPWRSLAAGLTSVAGILFSVTGLAAQTPPALVYSTYLGGSGQDTANAVAADADGNTYVAGWYQGSNIVKLGPEGDLLWSIDFGGSREENIYDIAVDAAGFLYVAGYSFSPEFPAVNSVPPEFLLHHQGLFVSKLDPDGDIVFTAKMSGPSANGRVEDLAVDSQGFVYLLGFASAGDFPTWRAYQPVYKGSLELLVVKLDPSGSLVYSTYLGGGNIEWPGAIEADAQGNAYLTGYTYSADFPLARKLGMANPTVWRSQAFVTKLSPDGSALVYSTFLGGKGGSENASDLAVDAAGNVYVAGGTNSPDFPVWNGLQPVLKGTSDAFLVKLGPQPAYLYATYFGGSRDDFWSAIALGTDGRIHATGSTGSPDYPLAEPLDSECAPVDAAGRCEYDVVVTTLDPTLRDVHFSTYLGGSIPFGTNRAEEREGDIAVVGAGELYLVGGTYSADFPTVNAIQSTHGGGLEGAAADAFASKIRISTVFNRRPDCSAAVATPSSIWPPDGRQVPVAILGVTDPDGDPIALEVTRIFQDELTGSVPDAGGVETAAPWVRAGRMNTGDGRVYHLFFEALDPAGGSCKGEVKVCVPLQSGSTCRDGGARIDSTVPR
jgi:hypothetical protein